MAKNDLIYVKVVFLDFLDRINSNQIAKIFISNIIIVGLFEPHLKLRFF